MSKSEKSLFFYPINLKATGQIRHRFNARAITSFCITEILQIVPPQFHMKHQMSGQVCSWKIWIANLYDNHEQKNKRELFNGLV